MRLIIGDLHIGISWANVDRTEDIFKFLEKLYDFYASANNNIEIVKEIVWLGDIFDSPTVPHSYIARFIKYLDKWKFVNHYILKGNHDGEPDSKRGSPLLEIEASGSATVLWEPTVLPMGLMVPYTTQEKLDAIKECCPLIFTHTDIIGATPGLEKEMSRGSPCVLPEKLMKGRCVVFSGHIHKPQVLNTNILIVGSVLKCDLSEKDDNKIYLRQKEDGKLEVMPISCRSLQKFVVDYSTLDGKTLYNDLTLGKGIISDAIVAIDVICPHSEAHLLDQCKFEDLVRKHCYHLTSKFNILKEKQFRMKELDGKKTDYEVTEAFLDKQGIADKNETLNVVKEIMND